MAIQHVARTSIPSLLRRRWRGLVERLAVAWRWLRTLYRVLLLVRFSLLLALVFTLALLFNDQAQDVARALGEQSPGKTVWFVAAALACAGIAWWSARVMFYFRFDNPASDPAVQPAVKAYLPRALGASALFFTGIAVVESAFAYGSLRTAAARWLVGTGVLLIGLAIGFFYATLKRRIWFARWVAARPQNLASLRALTWQGWLPLALVIVAGFALMVAFAYHAVALAPALGTGAVALLAAASLIAAGSVLVYAGNRYNLPVVSLVLIWAVVNSYLLVDNHNARLSADMHSYQAAPPAPGEPPPARADLRAYVQEWLAGLEAAAPVAPIPVVVVAAEGGGIRAAYWTAQVLTTLEEAAPDFARHVLAISGVSGGSLGGATFAGLIAEDAEKSRAEGTCADLTDLPARADAILARDFLSPTVAVLLFSDLFQQLVPYGFADDRAIALERAWEAAWRDCMASERFARPLPELWQGDRFAIPLLFLNSTVVETGQRLIASPVRIDPAVLSSALDGGAVLGPAVPLSAAIHDSARFTYISPAGTVRRQDPAAPGEPTSGDRWLRLVDGGYFENAGAVTAAELVDLIEQVASARGLEILPVVIQISNDPGGPPALATRRHFLGQIWAPIEALLQTRPARGYQARRDLARRVSQGARGYHFHFRLCAERDQPLPLGWALSTLPKNEMRRQLGRDDGPLVGNAERNRAQRLAIAAILAGERPPNPGDAERWPCPAAGS